MSNGYMWALAGELLECGERRVTPRLHERARSGLEIAELEREIAAIEAEIVADTMTANGCTAAEAREALRGALAEQASRAAQWELYR